MRRAKATAGMTGADYYQSVIYATYMNSKKKPFDDVRVRRALHLVIDRPVLVDVIKDVAPHMVGGFIYPFSEFATPKAELVKRMGYQPDQAVAIKEAKSLMAAAGYAGGIKGLDYLVRDVASFTHQSPIKATNRLTARSRHDSRWHEARRTPARPCHAGDHPAYGG